jgi:hypothetical protein
LSNKTKAISSAVMADLPGGLKYRLLLCKMFQSYQRSGGLQLVLMPLTTIIRLKLAPAAGKLARHEPY